eukprot:gene19445-21370_t
MHDSCIIEVKRLIVERWHQGIHASASSHRGWPWGLHFEPKKIHEFIVQVKSIVDAQFRNEDRAVIGKGLFKVTPMFSHLVPDNRRWGSMSHIQRMKVIHKFLAAGMGQQQEDVDMMQQCNAIEATSSITAEPLSKIPNNNCKLSITASESGIKTIPPNILESIFTKANQLLKIPGANNGSFIVAAGSNNTHTGGSLECDKACLHRSTKLCEHTLAVAERTNRIYALISWYIKSKAGPKITEMALSGGPKNARKKPSNRKRSNAKR